MVSPIYKKNIYVGVFESFWPDDSPVDFFRVNHDKYPLAKTVNFLDTTLEAGDCLYVPAYFYVQSKTVGEGIHDESILLIEQYESHSKMIDLYMKGLDDHGLVDKDSKDKAKFDQALKGAIEWMGWGV